jgi:hypothetical protein
VVQINELERVPENLQATLNQEALHPSVDRKDEVAILLNSERFVADYQACVWWDGCYYCQDDEKNWYRIICRFL